MKDELALMSHFITLTKVKEQTMAKTQKTVLKNKRVLKNVRIFQYYVTFFP